MQVHNKSVVYLGGFSLPNGNAAAQRALANAKLMSELDYNVLLVGLSPDVGNIGKFFVHEKIQCINLKYPHSLFEWTEYLFDYKQYEQFFEEYKPEIIVAYNHPAIALNRITDYCKKRGIKIVADCTEWYEPHGGWLFRKIKGWDVKKRMYDVHCRMDGVIAISRYLYDFYSLRGIHTMQLPPLVDKQEKKWHQISHINDNTIRLIFAGTLGSGYKDRLDIIVESLNDISENCSNTFQLDVVGISESQFKSLFNEWSNKSVPSFIHFHGRIGHEEVIRLLLNADFQIFIRDNSLANTAGFPTKFAETISANALVLTNASSNISDFLIEGVNGFLLDNSDKDKLEKSLKIPLLLGKEEIQEMRNRMDSSIFDYRRYSEQMKHFIEKL